MTAGSRRRAAGRRRGCRRRRPARAGGRAGTGPAPTTPPWRLHEGASSRRFRRARAGADAERAGGQRERDRRRTGRSRRSCADAQQRAPGRQHFAQQQRAAGADQRDRREHARAPERPAEARRPDRARRRLPSQPPPQHEAHEHADGDQRQPEHVALRWSSAAEAAASDPAAAIPAAAGPRPRVARRVLARVRGLARGLERPREERAGARLRVLGIPRNFDVEPPEPPRRRLASSRWALPSL